MSAATIRTVSHTAACNCTVGTTSRRAARTRTAIRRRSLAAALLGVSLVACDARQLPESTAREAVELRVMTYNIFAGKDESLQPNLDRVAALLDSLSVDVALLQEVDRNTERSGNVDQPGELERLTGMTAVLGRMLHYQGGEFGVAVLSRLPIVSTEVVPLNVEPPEQRADGGTSPRVALHVVVETAAGPVHVLNTHLHAASVGTLRRQELVGLMAWARNRIPPGAHLILGGDLNTRPDSDEIAALGLALRDVWDECGSGDGFTFPASRPDRRIDYLFIRSGDCIVAEVPASLASDHRPMLVTVGLR